MPIVHHPPAPFQAPISGSIDQRLQQMADAINTKISNLQAPAYHYIGLFDPTGQLWKVTVDTSGVLHTEVVERS